MINIAKRFRLVSFPMNKFRKGEALVAIFTSCKDIRNISIDFDDKRAISPPVLKRIGEKCSSVKSFSVNSSIMCSYQPSVTEFWDVDKFVSVPAFFPSLSSLVLDGVPLNFTDALLIALAKHCGRGLTTVVLA